MQFGRQPGKGDGDPRNPANWRHYNPPIVPALTSKFAHDARGVNGDLTAGGETLLFIASDIKHSVLETLAVVAAVSCCHC